MSLFGASGNANGATPKRPVLPPTQAHVPVSAIQDDTVIVRLRINKLPVTILTAVLRVGAVDITRMAVSERQTFIARYTETLRAWRFPRQVVIGRERQNLEAFLLRGSDMLRRWRRLQNDRRASLLARSLEFLEQVTAAVNPQIPAYFIALPHQVSGLKGGVTKEAYREGLRTLADRTRIVGQSLAALDIPTRRLDDEALFRLLYAFYHPSLPVLWMTPQERVASLLVSGEEEGRTFSNKEGETHS